MDSSLKGMIFFFRRSLALNLGAELAVEVHNHVLPAVDDGARTVEEAMQMLLFWAEMGYQKVIATPHQNTCMQVPAEAIEAAAQRLHAQLLEQEIPLHLTVAAEYLLEPELQAQLSALRTFGPRRYVLIELGWWAAPMGWDNFFFTLHVAGYTPVLAHPERYEYAHEKNLKEWYEKGVLMQINLLSLAGKYGRKAQHRAEYLLEKDWVAFAGSDLHHATDIPALREALQHKLLRKRLESLLNPTLL